jgi:hypothetical protein
VPVFPSARSGESLRVRVDGFPARAKKRRLRSTRGIATAILLQVDWLWPELICVPSQNCSGTGRSRWLCGIPISLRNIRPRLVDRPVKARNQKGHQIGRRRFCSKSNETPECCK